MNIKIWFTPITQLFIAGVFAILWTCMVIFISLNQPYLGLELKVKDEKVMIVAVDFPISHLSTNMVGKQLVSISALQQSINILPLDLTIEPDSSMESYAQYEYFLQRQQQLSNLLRQPQVQLMLSDGTHYDVKPQNRRSLHTLGSSFWIQLLVGVVSWLIATAVFVFRSSEAPARYLLLSGFATLMFSSFAGIYTTRELALPATLFQFLSDANFLGGSLYIACFFALLLYYPRRIAPRWVGIFILLMYVGYFIAQQYGVFESMSFARRFFVLIGLIGSLILAALHWQSSKEDPISRAALQWFLLSWVLGITLFVILILLPTLFGIDTSEFQGYAFLLVLMVYVGLALGVLQYRLFELGIWWGRTLLLLLSILTLFIMDIVFITLLHFSPQLSVTLSLVIVGLLWLPLRGWILEKFLGYLSPPKKNIQFRRIIGVALSSNLELQQQRWHELLQQHFATLDVEIGKPVTEVKTSEQGLKLCIPQIDNLSPVLLSYASQGRRLFSPHDITTATELCEIVSYAIHARHAYAAGVTEERHRIRRDLHDNISSQLVNALHHQQSQRKDEMIRNTITDLRDIINYSAHGGQMLDELLANIRAEIADRLSLSNLTLQWEATGNTAQYISLPLVHTLRSVLREAVHNIIRHAEAKHVKILFSINVMQIILVIQDDGIGLSPTTSPTQGQGLSNMQSRIIVLDGTIDWYNNSGLVIHITVPLQLSEREI